jgi:hypothetical protein
MLEDCKNKKGFMKTKNFKRVSVTFNLAKYYRKLYGSDVPWTPL